MGDRKQKNSNEHPSHAKNTNQWGPFLRANGFKYRMYNTSDTKFIDAFRGFFPHMMAPADLLRWWAPVPECGNSSLAKMRRSGIHIVEPAQARRQLAEATNETTYNNTSDALEGNRS